MNSKKESIIGRMLLPFSYLLIISVLAFNIYLVERVSKLSITVEHQQNRIADLENVFGTRKYEGNDNIISKTEQEIRASKGNELRGSARRSENSKITWATKLSEEMNKTKAATKMEDAKVFWVTTWYEYQYIICKSPGLFLILLDFLMVSTKFFVKWPLQRDVKSKFDQL